MCVKVEIPTLDFPSCISVNNLSQFTTQDLWRKLIFPLEYVEQRGLRYRLVTDSQWQAPSSQSAWNIWHTHQVHLGFLQLNLLLPQLLTVKQLHSEVLTQSGKIRKRYLISLTYFLWGNACFFDPFRTILPPGKLSCCLDESAEPSETNVWHFQMNFYPPFRSWLPESKGLKKRLIQLFLFHLRINPSICFCTKHVRSVSYNTFKSSVVPTWLVRVYRKHWGEHFTYLVFSSLVEVKEWHVIVGMIRHSI